jgi:hypothetical protein
LRRRGTKDWTSSIKKGQYSHSKTATPETPRSINFPDKYMFDDSMKEEDIDKYSACDTYGDYEQYFLHSFESIPIKISNSNDQKMSQIPNKISQNNYEEERFWNLRSLEHYSHMRHHLNSTFIKDSDEFSTEL